MSVLGTHASPDLTGQRFGRLVVQERFVLAKTNKNSYWTCLCDCGATHIVRGASLKQGRVSACNRWCGSNNTPTVEGILAYCKRDGDCLIWTGSFSRTTPVLGNNSRKLSVRRFLFEAKHGRLPPGVIVHYKSELCKNSSCCNIDHLTVSRRVEVPTHRALATTFRADEVLLADQIFNALLLGKDVRQLARQKSLSSLMSKFKKLRKKAESKETE